MTEEPLIADRVTTRHWELDLTLAGSVRSPKTRPANRKRQNIVRFVGREGTVERFTIRQTIPYCGYEVECPPTQAQYGAVCDFFAETCETRFQASTLLSARDYALMVTSAYPFTVHRKRFLSVGTTAFILSDKDLRSLVRAWNISQRGNSNAPVSATYARCFKKVSKFASKLIDDMRGSGAEIFG